MPIQDPNPFDAAALRTRLTSAVPVPLWVHWRAVAAVLVLLVAGGAWLLDSKSGGASPAGRSAEEILPRAQPSAPSGSGPQGPAGEVVVQASGAVEDPGVVKIPASARIADVVEAAGGFSPEADTERVNLAAKVVDGQRIYIVKKGQASAPDAVVGATGSSDGMSSGGSESSVIDLNAATVEELDKLPGVGPSTAKAIVDFRTKSGSFRSVEDLNNVKGIGPSKFEQIKPLVRV